MNAVSDQKALYHVRQYRPNFFTGFENEVVRNVPYEDLTAAGWFRNFEGDNFDRFTIEPYYDELMISAHYRSGRHWVAGFAINAEHELANDWRYKGMPR